MRLIDANARVEKIITGNKNTPFVFGEWDCCIYFSAIVMALLGDDQDPMKEFRGKYDDQKSAIRALREIGGKSVV